MKSGFNDFKISMQKFKKFLKISRKQFITLQRISYIMTGGGKGKRKKIRPPRVNRKSSIESMKKSMQQIRCYY